MTSREEQDLGAKGYISKVMVWLGWEVDTEDNTRGTAKVREYEGSSKVWSLKTVGNPLAKAIEKQDIV